MVNNTKNKKVERYAVIFHGYGANEEMIDNYTSYNTKLDNVPGMTKAYSQAIAAADKYNGTIYSDYGDGVWVELKQKIKR